MKLGDLLLKLIFWSGMSQKDVAQKCNISAPVLNDLIKGKRNISVKYAKAFENLFGIPTMIWLMWRNIDELNNKE